MDLNKEHVFIKVFLLIMLTYIVVFILIHIPNTYGWVSFKCDDGISSTSYNNRYNITIDKAYEIVYSGENSGCVITNAW